MLPQSNFRILSILLLLHFLMPAGNVCLAQNGQGNISNHFDTENKVSVFFPIDDVKRINKDSAIISIKYGKKDGIFWESEANTMSSYNANAKNNRESVEYMGPAKIASLKDSSAVFTVSLYKKFRNFELLPGDLVEIEIYTVKNLVNNLFVDLATNDIIFLNNERKEIKSKRQQIQNTDKDFEEKLVAAYVKEINNFYEDLLTYTDSTFTKPYEKGPFKGINMQEVFKQTTIYDMYSFLQFVKTFPGKYMGNKWKINETYATWVLNNAPKGDKNRTWIIPQLKKINATEIQSFARKNSYYIKSDTLSKWVDDINQLQTNGYLDSALSLCDKLILVAKELKEDNTVYEFYHTRSFISDAKGNLQEAIKAEELALQYDKQNLNYIYHLASLYGKNEEFSKCFPLYEKLLKELPGNSSVMGNYGWYKILAGKTDEASPLCKAAYIENSSSVAYTVNYGHTFLLSGNLDSAKYYYAKTLENCSTPSDYLEGPKTDFELFFKKGWSRKDVAEVADWMETQFNEKYYALTKGNDIWTDAHNAFDTKKYKAAIEKWLQYITISNSIKEPPLISIHNTYNWIGSSFSKLKNYDSAQYYYTKAMNIARDTLANKRDTTTTKDNDYLVNDYERLYSIYTSADNQFEAEKYKMLYDAEVLKVSELFIQPSLHLIVAGATQKNRKDKSSNYIFSHFSNLQNGTNKAGLLRLLANEKLTKESLTSSFDELRIHSKPEDIFIFYFTGNMTTSKNQSYLVFNETDSLNGKMSALEFMNYIDLIYAHKKIIICDKPAASLLSIITESYTNAGKNASEIIFLSPGIETPEQENGISLFANQLSLTLKELQNSNQFSAKDFVDKASYRIGRGKYYFPVLTFSFGKDFLLFEQKNNESQPELTATRGLKIDQATTQRSDETSGTQKNYALLFATDIYKDPGFHKLSNPIYDATVLAKILDEEFGFDVTLVKNPTLDEIESVLSRFRDEKNYGPNDQLFIFFAGHGLYYDKIKMGFLVASDSKVNDQNFKTYLSYNDLGSKYLKNINCNRIFLSLDACFAGSFFDNSSFRGDVQEVNAQNLATLKKLATKQRFYKGISSGAKQYVEDGKAGQHSPFAGKFLEVLLSKALNKNFVTADEIIGEIKSNPPGTTAICEGKFHYSDPQSHFIFELKNNQKVSSVKSDKLVK